MCTRPLEILNPKITHQSGLLPFNPRNDKEKIIVSCGHCPDCLQRKQKEWQTRAWYEYKNCKKMHGVVAYLTFTYNDDFLPIYEDNPVFCKRDLQLFLKNFRKQLSKFLGHNVEMRYLITSEYGDKELRPHYHALFYFYEPTLTAADIFKYAWCCWSPSPQKMLDIYEDRIKNSKDALNINLYTGLLRGMVQVGKTREGVKSLFVNSIAGITYVTKYISKDISFESFKDRLFRKYVIRIYPEFGSLDFYIDSHDTKQHPLLSVLRNDFLKDFKVFDLFHLQSHGFGSSLLDVLTDKQKELGTCCVPDLDKQTEKPAALPFYIQRKLYYDTKRFIVGLTLKLSKRETKKGTQFRLHCLPVWTTRYIYNNFGFKHDLCIFDSKVENAVNHVYELRNMNVNEQFMSNYFPSYSSSSEVWREFDGLLGFRPLKHLFEYKFLFQNRNVLDLSYKHYDKLPQFWLSVLKSPQLKDVSFPVLPYKYNTLYPFVNMDLCLSILDKFEKFYRYKKDLDFVRVFNARQKVDTLVNGKYKSARFKPLPLLFNY